MKKNMKVKSTHGILSIFSWIYKLALPAYIIYLVIFELFQDCGVSDIWSRVKKLLNSCKKPLKRKSHFIKMKLRDMKSM